LLCSLPVSEHVSKKGGQRGMCYRANTMRNRQWMKLGFELKCVVMRMSIRGLLKEMVFRCHAQTVHGLYVTVFVNDTILWSTTNFKCQFLTVQWETATNLHNGAPLLLLCHIIREQYCCIYIVLPLPDLSVMY